MKLRTILLSTAGVLLAAECALIPVEAGAATSAGEPPAPVVSNDQAHNTSVFACYNGGHFSYAEWRLPLPHTCWFPGDVLVQVPASTVTFKVDVPANAIGNTDEIKLTETCTSTFDGTGDAQNPSYACTIASP